MTLISENQSFVIKTKNKKYLDVIKTFKNNFTTYSKIPDPKRKGKFYITVDKVYTAGNEFSNEYIFSKSEWPALSYELKNAGLKAEDLEFIDNTTKEFEKFDFTINPKYTDRDHQPQFIKALVDSYDKRRTALVDLQTGQGKFLKNSTLIKIPNLAVGKSWKPIGDLIVGDYVIGRDGLPTKVIGVYPQGVKKIYKITFGDDRVSYAGEEHLWEVISPVWSDKTNKEKGLPGHGKKVISTGEIEDYLNRNSIMYIPLCESEKSKDISLPMNPYLLGKLISNGDMAIRETLKLQDKKSIEKIIPEIYRNGSTEQRWNLLQGLMDVNGTIEKDDSVTYTTSSKKLAEDIQYIVRSLGGICKIITKKPSYIHNEEKQEGNINYILQIRLKETSRVFTLSSKKDIVDSKNQYNEDLKLQIISIEYSHDEEATCIAVDNEDRLYVAEDFVVTHNTYIACKALSELKYRFGVYIKPGYINKWIGDIKELLLLEDNDFYVVAGSDSLRKIIQLGIDGEEIPKVIIFSSRTMFLYFKSYENMIDTAFFNFPVIPIELNKILNIGIMLVDETHEEFFSVFKMSLYIQPKLIIGLSATLITGDRKLNNLYNVLFPENSRLSFIAYKKYITVKATRYHIENMRGINHRSKGGRGYSHIELEKSIIRNHILLNSYIDMVKYYLEEDYIKRKTSKDHKAMVFFATVEMCTIVTKRLSKMYPKLDIRRYTGDDPYEKVIDADIRISTVKSSGTAIDIPGLISVLQTINMSSPQANLQALGRLREIPGFDVIYRYLWTPAIRKHKDYHEEKKELFNGRIKVLVLEDYRGRVTC